MRDCRHTLVQRKQRFAALEALRRLRPPDDLAQAMGEELGPGEVLLGRLSYETRHAGLQVVTFLAQPH
jgi:hypothetical protein